jgi:hypothetical protein
MNWLKRLLSFSGRAHLRSDLRCRARLNVEALEGRLVPASVFVVPLNVIPDGAHFHRLADAIVVAGMNGTVTIEPGTTPDNTNVNVNQQGITIQGDPNVSGSILSAYSINVVANGVVLTNMQLANVQFGGGFNATAITKCLINNIVELGSGAGNGGSTITQNVITGAVALNGNTNTSTNDLVANNILSSFAPVILSVSTGAGDVISSNQFFGDGANQVAILAVNTGSAAMPTTVANNTITLIGAGTVGVSVTQQTLFTAVSVVNNAVNTGGQGQGVVVQMNAAGSVRVIVQGNEFHNNAIGVTVRGDGVSSALNVDLGGGLFNSLGGNNFRGFLNTGTTANAAILLLSTPINATLFAQRNMFNAAITPTNVINDRTHGSATGTGNIDVGNALSPPRAFVQALYNELLGRTGSLSELDGWVTIFNQRGQPAVVNGILRSTESLGRIVDTFYLRFLGRNSDSAGRAGWVQFLQRGGTLEAMTTAFVTSTEYINRINVDYVQSLYISILGRTGSQSELAAWNNNIQSLGLVGIANGFSNSTEYRSNFVFSFFVTFLHRVPSPTEVSNIVAMTGDILSLQAFVLNSAEYFNNG